MYPFSYEEFLRANEECLLVEAYRNATPESPLSELVHDKLIERQKVWQQYRC
jgi:hypothetical protein